MKTLKFLNEECSLEIRKYQDGSPAIQLFCQEGPMATATVNIGKKPPKNHIYLKDYSENEGMAQAFETANLGKIVGRETVGHAQGGVVLMEITDPELLAACYPEKKAPTKAKQPAGPEM